MLSALCFVATAHCLLFSAPSLTVGFLPFTFAWSY